MRLFVFLLTLSAGAAWAGEFAMFASGARMRVDRHEVEGSRIRLYTGSGYADVNAADILGFEPEEPAGTAPPAVSMAAVAPKARPTPAELADAAADRYGLPRKLVRSVMAAESGFQPAAVSAKGAIGLMQLMPATAESLGANPYDPAENVDAGARYLRELLIRYNFGLWHALAAYNAGPGAVDRAAGIPPYRETVNYINRIGKNLAP